MTKRELADQLGVASRVMLNALEPGIKAFNAAHETAGEIEGADALYEMSAAARKTTYELVNILGGLSFFTSIIIAADNETETN